MRAWMIGAAIVLAGCTSMPMSGPTIGAIETAALESDSTLQPFAFAAITPETLEVLDRRRREPLLAPPPPLPCATPSVAG